MTEAQFVSSVKDLGIEINKEQLSQLSTYCELLISWNKNINLTSIVEPEQIYLKHFYDSITILKVIDLNKINTLCDVGTGAGFPGIVLKILYPHLSITLIDATNKKILFLKEVVKKLGLDNVTLVTARAEEFAKENREKYDVVTSRAVANLRILLEYCIPLLKVNGYFIPLKGKAIEEIESSKEALALLFLTLEETNTFRLPLEDSERMIIKIKKNKITPLKYPRAYKDILKRPL